MLPVAWHPRLPQIPRQAFSSSSSPETQDYIVKTQRFPSLLAWLPAALVLLAAPVLEAQTAANPAREAAAKEEAVVLSPFEVSAEKDNGYRASGTLAGTRLRTELRDVAASVSVVTKEFMQDIGANNLDELLTYTLGTEVSGLTGNFSNPGQDANFTDLFGQIRSVQTSNRVRGVGGADQTREYFITSVPLDGYNTDRVEVNRGPNAMLFGLGSAAGIINNGLIKALPHRNRTKVETQYGQYGTYRTSLDHNQVLLKDRLAVRAATLFGEKKYRIEPNYLRDERVYLTATARPWKTGTLRVSTEYAKQFSNKAYNSPPTDSFSWWWALGKPVYDPTTGVGSYLGTEPADVNLRVFNATGGIQGNLISSLTRQPLLVLENPNVARLGITGLDPSIQAIEGSNTRVRLNSTGTAFANDSMRTLGNPKAYLQALNLATRPALANFWKDTKLTDPAIFDFYHESLEGPNKREWAFWKTYNASFEQRLGAHAGFEVAFDKQFLDAGYVEPNQFRNHMITVDINTRLPNGAPNPNLGRPVVYGAEGFQSQSATDREAFRATAYYNLDLSRMRANWLGRLLGRHIFTGSFTSQERRGESGGGRPYQLGVDYWQAESANETRSIVLNDNNRLMSRLSYIGPSLLNATGPRNNGLQGIRVNNGIDGASSVNVLYYQTPPTTPVALAPWQTRTFSVLPTGKYDLLSTRTGPSRNGDDIKSSVFVANSYWWDHTIVSTLGWRQDAYKTYDAGTSLTDPATGLKITDPAVWKWNAPTLDDSKRSFNYGFVLHQPPFLRGKLPLGAQVSLTYNKSDNFRPSAQRYDQFNEKIAPPTGKTKEWGALLSLFHHKLELRAVKYETAAALASAGAFTELQNTVVRRLDSQIENNSSETYLAVAPPAALAAWNQFQQGPVARQLFTTFNFVFRPGPNNTTIVDHDTKVGTVVSTTDVLATGYEFDVVYNPTSSWRIAFNAARQQTVSGNTGATFARLIALLDPVWGGTAAALPDGATATTNLGQTWATVKANAEKAIALDGAPSPELRRWRCNVVSNYSFRQGALKGWRAGGAYRWQDKSSIGYPVRAFSDGSLIYDVKKPYYGPTENNLDGWIGYGRRVFGDRIQWSVQLNVRNIGVGNRFIPVSAQPDGTYDTMRIAEPQTWLLTNTFEF